MILITLILIAMLHKKNYRKLSIWECDVCKSHFEIQNSRIREGTHHFCSKPCRLEWSKKVDSKRVVNWMKNNKHPNCKGGIGITTDGYIWIRIKGQGYFHDQIKLHRYLMQVKLGRRLLPDEIVHHINGDKLDNSIENLQLTTKSEHNRIHGWLTAEHRTKQPKKTKESP